MADVKQIQTNVTIKEATKEPEQPEQPVQPAPQAPQASGDIETIVRQAARKYGVDENYLVHIAHCESTMNPNAVNTSYYENGHPSGLFQHISGYYPARAAKYGYSTDVFDPYSNANVTAAMFRDGHSNLWECN